MVSMVRAFCGSLLTLATFSFFVPSARPQSPAALGSLKGTVRLATPLAALVDLPVSRNQGACRSRTPDPSLVVGSEGAVANAVVTLANVDAPVSPPREPARLDQKACVFLPHVQAVPAGAILEIANSDPILHNVHAYLGSETLFNVAMPVQNYRVRRKLERPGVIRLQCDAGHTWMSGYIWVSPHPYYAVTDGSGAYVIKDVPPGSYQIRVWHELLGEKRLGVTIGAGKTTPLSIELSGPTPSR